MYQQLCEGVVCRTCATQEQNQGHHIHHLHNGNTEWGKNPKGLKHWNIIILHFDVSYDLLSKWWQVSDLSCCTFPTVFTQDSSSEENVKITYLSMDLTLRFYFEIEICSQLGGIRAFYQSIHLLPTLLALPKRCVPPLNRHFVRTTWTGCTKWTKFYIQEFIGMFNMEQELENGFEKAGKLAHFTKWPKPTVLILSEY